MTGSIIFWIFILVAGIIVELATLQFVSIWFAIASIPALILASIGQPIWLQAVVFFVVSAILVICTRPFVKSIQKNIVATNSELDVGKKAVVTEAIDNEKNAGRVNLNGVYWSARTSDNSCIGAGATVVVDKIDGSKLIVSAEK